MFLSLPTANHILGSNQSLGILLFKVLTIEWAAEEFVLLLVYVLHGASALMLHPITVKNEKM